MIGEIRELLRETIRNVGGSSIAFEPHCGRVRLVRFP